MEKVLVTGGAGYIGSILVDYLLRARYEVTVLDNFMYRQASLNHFCSHSSFKVINGDVRDTTLVAGLMSSADIIIPLAALVGAPLCGKDPLAATSINKDAVLSMLSMKAQNQIIIMPTTNSGYGQGESNGYCDENSPLRPLSKYAIDKVAVEKRLMDETNVVSLRLATVFGMSPRMRLDLLVNDFCHRALVDKFIVLFESSFRRNYIHVRDVSRAFLHVLDNFELMKNQVFNCGLSEANLTKKELCDQIKMHVPTFCIVEAPIGEDPDKRDYLVSNSKLESTGFHTDHSLDFGIKELLQGLIMLTNRRYGNV